MSDQEFSTHKKSWVFPEGETEIRLDAFARRCLPHLSRRQLEKAIAARVFWINDRQGKKGDRLVGGDVLTFAGPDYWLSPHPSAESKLKVSILYEDPHVLAVDKPAGVATHGFSGKDGNTLANFLLAIRPELERVGKSPWEPGLVHRLDRETSGVLLVAKRQESFDNLRRQFRRGLIEKKYQALVWGESEREGSVSYPMIHDSSDRRKMKAVVKTSSRQKKEKKWRALTRYRTLATSGKHSLLEIEMATGVTHQIRVHLAAIGHPIVGDDLYGAQHAESLGLDRHFLHATSLAFSHPADDREVKIESRLPEKLGELLRRLRVES